MQNAGGRAGDAPPPGAGTREPSLPEGRIEGTVVKISPYPPKGRKPFGFITHSSRSNRASEAPTRYYFAYDELVMAEPNAPLYTKVKDTVEFAVEERGDEIFAVDITRPGGQGLPSRAKPPGARHAGLVTCGTAGRVLITSLEAGRNVLPTLLPEFIIARGATTDVYSFDGCTVEYSVSNANPRAGTAVYITQAGGAPLDDSCVTSAASRRTGDAVTHNTKRARSPACDNDIRDENRRGESRGGTRHDGQCAHNRRSCDDDSGDEDGALQDPRRQMLPDPRVVASLKAWSAAAERLSDRHGFGNFRPNALQLDPPIGGPSVSSLEHQMLAFARCAVRETSRFCLHSDLTSLMAKRCPETSKVDRGEAIDRLMVRGEVQVWHGKHNEQIRVVVPSDWRSVMTSGTACNEIGTLLQRHFSIVDRQNFGPPHRRYTGPVTNPSVDNAAATIPSSRNDDARRQDDVRPAQTSGVVDREVVATRGAFQHWKAVALSPPTRTHNADGEIRPGAPRLAPARRPVIAVMEHEILALSRLALRETTRFVQQSAVISVVSRRVAASVSDDDRQEAFDRLTARAELGVFQAKSNPTVEILVPRDWVLLVPKHEAARLAECLRKDYVTEHDLSLIPSVEELSSSTRGAPDMKKPMREEKSAAAPDNGGPLRGRNDDEPAHRRSRQTIDGQDLMLTGGFPTFFNALAQLGNGHENGEFTDGCPRLPPSTRIVGELEHELLLISRTALVVTGRFVRKSDAVTCCLRRITTSTRQQRMEAFDRLEERKEVLLKCMTPNDRSIVLVPRDWRRYVSTKRGRRIDRLIHRDLSRDTSPVSCSSDASTRADSPDSTPRRDQSRINSADRRDDGGAVKDAVEPVVSSPFSADGGGLPEDSTATSRPTPPVHLQKDMVLERVHFRALVEPELARFSLPNVQNQDPDAAICDPCGIDLLPAHHDAAIQTMRTRYLFFTRKAVRLARKFPRSDDMINYIAGVRCRGTQYTSRVSREALRTLHDEGVMKCESASNGVMFLMPANWSQLSAGDPQLREAVLAFVNARGGPVPALTAAEPPSSIQQQDLPASVLPLPGVAPATASLVVRVKEDGTSVLLPPAAPTPTAPSQHFTDAAAVGQSSTAFPPPSATMPSHVSADLSSLRTAAAATECGAATPEIPALFKANETPEIVRWRSFWAQVRDRAQWDAAKTYRRTLDGSVIARFTPPAPPSIGEMSSILIEGAVGSLAEDVEKDVAQLVAYLARTCAPSVIHNVSVGSRDLASDHGTTGYGVRGLGRAVLLLTAQLGTAAEAERLRAALPAAMRVETAVGEPLATTTMTLRGRALDHIPNDIIESVFEGFGPCRVTCVEDTAAPPLRSAALQAPAAFLQIPGAMLGGTRASSVSRGARKRDRDDGEGEGATESAKEVIAVTFTDPRHGAADCRACLRAVQFHMAAEWQCVASMASVGVERAALNRTAKASAI